MWYDAIWCDNAILLNKSFNSHYTRLWMYCLKWCDFPISAVPSLGISAGPGGPGPWAQWCTTPWTSESDCFALTSLPSTCPLWSKMVPGVAGVHKGSAGIISAQPVVNPTPLRGFVLGPLNVRVEISLSENRKSERKQMERSRYTHTHIYAYIYIYADI